MSQILSEVDILAQEFEEEKQADRTSMMDTLKSDLQDVSLKLRDAQIKKDNLEAQIKLLNQEMEDLETEIRRKLEPYLCADKAELTLSNGIVLSAKPTMNIGVEDNEATTAWLMTNGYKDVLKWQIHNQTLKKIARENLESGTTIPGLRYQKFTLIKIK